MHSATTGGSSGTTIEVVTADKRAGWTVRVKHADGVVVWHRHAATMGELRQALDKAAEVRRVDLAAGAAFHRRRQPK